MPIKCKLFTTPFTDPQPLHLQTTAVATRKVNLHSLLEVLSLEVKHHSHPEGHSLEVRHHMDSHHLDNLMVKDSVVSLGWDSRCRPLLVSTCSHREGFPNPLTRVLAEKRVGIRGRMTPPLNSMTSLFEWLSSGILKTSN